MARKIVQVFTRKQYLAITVLATGIMLAVYPMIQTAGSNNLDLWLSIITPWNLALYIIFSITFGVLLSFQILRLREPKACSIAKSAGTGGAGTVLGVAVLQCPGCVSLISLFLPLNATIFLATFNTLLTLASIGLMLVSIWFLGGFKPAASALPGKELPLKTG